jgi:hypothetical protein
MAEEVEFGDNVTTKKTKKQIGLKLFPPRKDKSIRIRFVGTQQKIYQRWDKNTRTFSFADSHKEGYAVRVVSFVVDREDDDKVKAFLCPSSIWNTVGEYSSNHDFAIHRKGMGLDTRYDVRSLGESEVSQDILDRVEITSQVHSLSDIFVKDVRWELLDKDHEPIECRFDILDL